LGMHTFVDDDQAHVGSVPQRPDVVYCRLQRRPQELMEDFHTHEVELQESVERRAQLAVQDAETASHMHKGLAAQAELLKLPNWQSVTHLLPVQKHFDCALHAVALVKPASQVSAHCWLMLSQLQYDCVQSDAVAARLHASAH